MFLHQIDHIPQSIFHNNNTQHSPPSLKITPQGTPPSASNGIKAKLNYITNRLPKLPCSNSPKVNSGNSTTSGGSITNVNGIMSSPPQPVYLNFLSNQKVKEVQITREISERSILIENDEPLVKKSSRCQPKVSKNLPAVFLNDLNKKLQSRKASSRDNSEKPKNAELSMDKSSPAGGNQPNRNVDVTKRYNRAFSARKNSPEPSQNILLPLKISQCQENRKCENENDNDTARHSTSSPRNNQQYSINLIRSKEEKIILFPTEVVHSNPNNNVKVENQRIKKLIIFKKLNQKPNHDEDTNTANKASPFQRINDESQIKPTVVANFETKHLFGIQSKQQVANTAKISQQQPQPQEQAINTRGSDSNFSPPEIFANLAIIKKPTKSNDLKGRYFERHYDDEDDNVISKKLQHNEFITLRKIKSTINHGVIKRMLHVPSFKIYDILEEPLKELHIKENIILRDWINSWKQNLPESQYLQKIHDCFWNSPEGCISVLIEPLMSTNFLDDLLFINEGLPESCIQELSHDLLNGLKDLYESLKTAHGFISPAEIAIDNQYKVKLLPGISARMNGQAIMNQNLSKKVNNNNDIQKKTNNNNNHIEELFQNKSPKNSLNISSARDIFDFGLTLLQCALGSLDYTLDQTNFLSIENINNLLDYISTYKRHSLKGICCLGRENKWRRGKKGKMI